MKIVFQGTIAFVLVFILIIVLRNFSPQELKQSFEWITRYVLPWLFFFVFVHYLYRNKK